MTIRVTKLEIIISYFFATSYSLLVHVSFFLSSKKQILLLMAGQERVGGGGKGRAIKKTLNFFLNFVAI